MGGGRPPRVHLKASGTPSFFRKTEPEDYLKACLETHICRSMHTTLQNISQTEAGAHLGPCGREAQAPMVTATLTPILYCLVLQSRWAQSPYPPLGATGTPARSGQRGWE
jgi:hypothetical protein